MGRKTTHHHVLRKFGRKMQRARKRAGITQEQLAADIAMNRTYVGLLERGQRNPTLTTLYKIGKALRASTSDLLPF